MLLWNGLNSRDPTVYGVNICFDWISCMVSLKKLELMVANHCFGCYCLFSFMSNLIVFSFHFFVTDNSSAHISYYLFLHILFFCYPSWCFSLLLFRIADGEGSMGGCVVTKKEMLAEGEREGGGGM